MKSDADTSSPPQTSGLNLEEKAALVSGRDFWSTRPIDAAGIPSIVLTDGPHGVRRQSGQSDHLGLNGSLPATCFPPAVAIGSSWNPAAAERIGAAVAAEAQALGVHMVLGPGVNIKRSPLCGRNFEYYSEDPLLSGALGAAHVRGQQAGGVGASVKHFAANNQETDRMRVSADVDERTLREIYLPAFERTVIDAKPASVMCAYNRINGVFAAENTWLLTDILRQEWGFAGAVISDWGAVHDPVASLEAGLDLEMPGTGTISATKIVDAVRASALDEATLDRAVSRVVAMVERSTRSTGYADLDAVAADHHDLARKIAAECVVLLKNEGAALPLSPDSTIAVIGEFAGTPRFQGGGSSRVNPLRVDTPLDALLRASDIHGGDLVFATGFTTDDTGTVEDLLGEATAVARSADVAIVFVGLAETDESEGFDRQTLELPAEQIEVIRAVADVAPRMIVVLSNGGVVSVEGWHDEADAILEAFLLGQAGGAAIADVLFGAANPSGRLAETVPTRLADTASFVNFPGEQGHVRYGEGVMVGYRWHETVGVPARYPFGYGLSYSTFAMKDLEVDVTGDAAATASVTVINTSDRRGGHVVQLYVATTAGPVRRPRRELRAFDKVFLEPGESRAVTLTLERRAFAYWDVVQNDWVVTPGTYRVQIGQDAATVLLEEVIQLVGEDLVADLTFDSTVDEWAGHPVIGPTLIAEITADLPADGAASITPDLLRMIGSMPMQKVVDMLGASVPAATFERLLERSRAGRT